MVDLVFSVRALRMEEPASRDRSSVWALWGFLERRDRPPKPPREPKPEKPKKKKIVMIDDPEAINDPYLQMFFDPRYNSWLPKSWWENGVPPPPDPNKPVWWSPTTPEEDDAAFIEELKARGEYPYPPEPEPTCGPADPEMARRARMALYAGKPWHGNSPEAKADREAYMREKAEREAKEKAEREAKEKAEHEAKEAAERAANGGAG